MNKFENIVCFLKGKVKHFTDYLKGCSYKDLISFLVSVIVGCFVAYFIGLSIYNEEGCSNSLSVILNSGVLGFIMFCVSSISAMFLIQCIVDSIKNIYRTGFKGIRMPNINWKDAKEAFLFAIIILLVILIGGYIAGQILNMIIC